MNEDTEDKNRDDETVQLVIRVTRKEREQIKQRAIKQGKTLNQYASELLLASKTSTFSNYDSNDNNASKGANSDSTNDYYINLLLNQIDKKDSQLESKDQLINEVYNLLSQQQQLALGDKREKDNLRLELKEARKQLNSETDTADTDEETIETSNSPDPKQDNTENKKGFFSRLFRR